MTDPIPTLHELSPHGDLDGNRAAKNFLGKTKAEASALFMENALYYGEDLMWMGEKAFAYYLPALCPYLRSIESVGDSSLVDTTIMVLDNRLESEPSSILLAYKTVLWILYYFRDNLERFSLDPRIDRNVPKKLKALTGKVEQLDG